ncbi:unnamed protein product [Microthlaspi erraticum]|uniref:F-box domain-containing protein n=1 Tax=Microthlaspi erraticum TaxID=1685480 RepID=A0A6D2IHG5_9BRAS|nr:unnamed protein product [Microthlaspi erraticum]
MIVSEVEPPQEKKMKDSHSLSFSSLPDEIAENCIARISKWNYPNLSLVSKRFLSLLSSPELYTTRSHIGTTEPCLYICVQHPKHQRPKWFTLWMKPDEIKNDYQLIPLQSSSPTVPYDSTIAVGSEIYVIGGSYEAPSSSVRVLNCRSHTWRNAPNMTVAREEATAILLDQKIYVMGGCVNDKSSANNWFEVFDINTQTWSALPSPRADYDELRQYIVVNAAVKGKIYAMAQEKEYTYEPTSGAWEVVREKSSHLDVWCAIENVMYCCTYAGHLCWYDYEAKEWREIKGLEYLRGDRTWGLGMRSGFGLVNYGGKLVVMRPRIEKESLKLKVKIWCAKIALEKRVGGEVWGKIEWLNSVLKVPKSYEYCVSCVAVSI